MVLHFVDEENIFEGSLETLNTMNLGTEFEITNEEISIDEVKNKIVNGDVDDAIIINESDNKVNVEYIVKNMAMMNNEVPEKVTNMLTSVYTNLQISKLGLTQEQLASLQTLLLNYNKQKSKKLKEIYLL